MEGKNLRLYEKSGGFFPVEQILKDIKTKPDGFYEYNWPKPHTDGVFSKYAYVKLLSPLNWVIGTEEYPDEVKSNHKK